MESTTFQYNNQTKELLANQVDIDGHVENGVVVGTFEWVDSTFRIGQGQAIHNGSSRKAIITKSFKTLHRGFPRRGYSVGDEIVFEPIAVCGAHSTYRGGMRGRNSLVTGMEVTCKSCIKKSTMHSKN